MNNQSFLTDSIKQYINYLVGIRRLEPRTVSAYSYDLTRFNLFMIEKGKKYTADIEESDIEAFLANISQSKIGSTANYNRKVSSLQNFYRFLIGHGFGKNPLRNIKPSKNHTHQISYLNEEERLKLLITIDEKATAFYRSRDLAIISIFLATGIRVSELANLKLSDFEFKGGGISYLSIKRKGGGEARLPVPEPTAKRIIEYLEKRKINSENMFLSKRGESLRQNSIYYLVRRYLMMAGIKKKKWGPHVLRHTTAVALLKQKVDLMSISVLLGHKSLNTTAIYLHVEPKNLEDAVNSISI